MAPITPIDLINKYLTEECFSLKDTGVKHWLIRHLDKNSLLLSPPSEEPGTWRRFGLQELVWLRLVVELRKLHVGNDTLKEIKKELFLKRSPKSLGFSAEDLKMRAKKIFENIPMEDSGDVDKLLESSEFMEYFGSIETNLIDSFLSMILVKRWHYSLVFSLRRPADSNVLEMADSKVWMTYFCLEQIQNLVQTPDYLDLFSKNGVIISLNSLLVDILGEKTVKEKHTMNIAVLTEKENAVWQAIRSGKYKKVTIFFGTTKKPDRMELTSMKKVETEARFMDFIYKSGYQRMEIEIENGAIVACEDTKKQRL
jgi:DNA-binding transcriptional MerR regulator